MPDQPAIVTDAIKFLKRAKGATQHQRDRERAALRFQVPELQWDTDSRAARGPTTIDGVQIPARPMLAIPKLNQPIQLILNQEKAAHLGVHVSPLSEDADDDTAEVQQDLYRREEQRSRAGLARSWGFDRAVKAGWGCYRINTEYDDESDNPFDQKIVWQRLLYQDAAYFDPAALEPDWCDGEEALVASYVPKSRYKREYPDSELAHCDAGELAALLDEAPEWVTTATDEDEEAAYLVAEYFRKEYTKKTWVVLDDGSFAYEDEIPEGRKLHPDPKVSKKRKIAVPKVMWYKINALEVLEQEELNGKYIPLIPVVGVELQPFDQERRWQGLIEPGMDGQKLFNHAASSAVELSALEPKAPFDVDPREIEGYEAFWQVANVRNLPYLPRHKFLDGKPTGALQRIQTDAGKLGPAMMLLQQADNFIQASTATFDPSLGRLPTKDRSGIAIARLQEQSDAGNSHFLHNLATITMPYEAKVVLDLMGKIYDRPGRVARLLDQEDNERTVILNAPFTVDVKTKRPRRVQVPGPNGQSVCLECGDPRVPKEAKTFDLRKGSYGSSVTIGKSWETRLQEGSNEIGTILQGDRSGQMMTLVGPTYFKFRRFPGSKEVADVLKKLRSQQYPFLDQKDGEQPDAEQLKAQLQALQQQTQMLQQQLQQAGQIIQTDQVKQQAHVATEQAKVAASIEAKRIDANLKLQLEDMKNRTQIAVAEIAAMAKGVAIDQEAFHDAIARDHEHQQEAAQAAADRSAAWDMQEEAAKQAQAQAALEPQAPPNGDQA
jgi:hypothetical protein